MKKSLIGASLLFAVVLATGCSNKSETTAVSESTTSQSTTVKESTNATTKETSTSSEENGIKISLEQALKKYEETYPDTDIISLDLDQSFGTYYYKIEGVDDSKEYEISVQAVTGEVKKEREETLDQDEQNGVKRKEDAVDTKDLLSITEVSALAEKEIGKGTSKEWQLEQELGITYWEVKVVDGTKEFEVKINAQSGEIIERSQD